MDTEERHVVNGHVLDCMDCYFAGYSIGHGDGFAEARHQGKRVLTDDAVREIRRRQSAGVMLKVLAAEYGVSVAAISKVCRRETYFDVR